MDQFEFPQIPADLTGRPDAEEAYLALIRERVRQLLESDTDLLFSHLYRLDVSEKALNLILKTQAPELWPELLAEAIWARQKARLSSKKETRVKPIHEEGWDY